MEEQQILPATGEQGKRPTLLTVLCILTFIGSGLNFFSNLIIFIFFDTSIKSALAVVQAFNMPELKTFFETVRPVYFASTAAISALALFGSVMMWQMKKLGFHIYTVSQILVILAPMYFFGFMSPDFFNLLISGVFVLLYSKNLKVMS
jgi:hypothetical protein